MDPRNAAKTTMRLPVIKPKLNEKPCNPITTKATPKLAPALIPRICGPANGFLNKVCMSKPLIDKNAPQSNAPNALGNLDSRIMSCQLCFSCSPLNKIFTTSEKGISIDPREISRTNNNNADVIRKIYFMEFVNYYSILR